MVAHGILSKAADRGPFISAHEGANSVQRRHDYIITTGNVLAGPIGMRVMGGCRPARHHLTMRFDRAPLIPSCGCGKHPGRRVANSYAALAGRLQPGAFNLPS
jgi:hypothetical protein